MCQPDADTLRVSLEPLFCRCFSADLERAYFFIDRLCLHLCFRVVHDCNLLKPHPEAFDDMVSRIGAAPEARYLLNAVLDLLAEEGFAAGREDGWESLRPCPPDRSVELQQEARVSCRQALATFELLERCHEHAPTFIAGREPGMAAIFPRGDIQLWERLHAADAVMSVYADVVLPTLEAVLHPRACVLEVGGGVGAVLQRCLPSLRASDVREYCFSDIGWLFVQKAQQRYGREAFMRFLRIDLDGLLFTQGLEAESFDVVIAVNVLHSARDLGFALRELLAVLKPGGWLICGEGSPPSRERRWRLDLIFAFLRGWWDVSTDPVLRPRPGFLLPAEWGTALLASGYQQVRALPGEGWFAGPCRGGLIMARKGICGRTGNS
jgi:SAM-dependent methyltransferase